MYTSFYKYEIGGSVTLRLEKCLGLSDGGMIRSNAVLLDKLTTYTFGLCRGIWKNNLHVEKGKFYHVHPINCREL